MKRITLKQIFCLQVIIIIYTISGIMAKFASLEESIDRIGMFFALDILFLGIYAIFWQQMIKALPLSVAYVNRAMALLWSTLWAKIIFGESITGKQLLAIGLVVIGTIIVNGEDHKKENYKEENYKEENYKEEDYKEKNYKKENYKLRESPRGEL